MIRSMTGFGRAELSDSLGRWSLEIRTVNHRYCEISLRLPRFAQHLEGKVRAVLQDRLMRGKISANINFEGQGAGDAAGLKLDFAILDRYHALLTEARARYGMSSSVDMRTLAQLPDVWVWDAGSGDGDSLWPTLEKLTEAGCKDIIRMKDQEGASLAEDLRKRVGFMLNELEQVEKRAPLRVEEARARLADRLNQLLDASGPVDPNRLAQEVAFYVDRLDCTEECVRLRAHCKHFEELLAASPSAGRKLNFLIQEMHREANTIGSKANDPSLSQHSINMKEELEKLREQIQNIE